MELIGKYIQYLRYELNSSAHTVCAYKGDLEQFAAFITGGKPETFTPLSVSRDDIRSWIADLGRRGEKASSLRRKIIALRSLYRYLRKQNLIAANPGADIPLPRLPKPLPAFVKEQEMEELLQESDFETDDFRTFRDKLILEILYSTGLRCSELTGLKDSDIDASRMELKVTGKRSKQRFIPIHPDLLRHINRYRTLRDAHCPDHADRLIIGMRGGAMNNSALRDIINTELAPTSASKKSPHVLRHTFATTLLRHGTGINSVKELLGHSSLSTTQIYTHLTLSELRQNYITSHPRARASESDKQPSAPSDKLKSH